MSDHLPLPLAEHNYWPRLFIHRCSDDHSSTSSQDIRTTAQLKSTRGSLRNVTPGYKWRYTHIFHGQTFTHLLFFLLLDWQHSISLIICPIVIHNLIYQLFFFHVLLCHIFMSFHYLLSFSTVYLPVLFRLTSLVYLTFCKSYV